MNEKTGLSCTHCGSKEVLKNGTREFARRYKCKSCNKQFSVSIQDSFSVHKFLNMLDACVYFTEETTPKEMRCKIISVKHLFEIIPKLEEIKNAAKNAVREAEEESRVDPMDRISTLSPAELNDLEDRLVREKERRIQNGELVWGYERFKKREDGTYYNASNDIKLGSGNQPSYKDEECEEEEEEEMEDEEFNWEEVLTEEMCEYLENNPSWRKHNSEEYFLYKEQNPDGTPEEFLLMKLKQDMKIRNTLKREKDDEPPPPSGD